MSTSNHWPTAGEMPGVHRELPLPSMAWLAGLLEAETDALAVHPVRGNATGVVPPELLLLELPPLLDEAETSVEASIPDEPPLEELLLEELPPTPPPSAPLPDPVPLPPDEDVPIMPDDDVLLADELLPLDDEPAPLDPEPLPPPMPLPLDEEPPPSSAA
jgi:hypothetical protein